MRLDPERELAPQTVEAIADLLANVPVPDVSDAELLRLILGIADAETRLACARALLASPSVTARLIDLRSRLRRDQGLDPPLAEDAEDLARLSAFAAPFDGTSAARVFPSRFARPERLLRLVDLGWVVLTRDHGSEQLYSVAERPGLGSVPAIDDEGWRPRYVEHFVDAARTAYRLLAEGRWEEGASSLRRQVPDFRAAWNTASSLGDHEAVASLVDSLSAELMEIGYWGDLTDLASAGYRASEALGRPSLRSRLLSYEGVAATRTGDRPRAQALWERRVELNRQIGNPVAETDALLDLTLEALEAGDADAWRKWEAQAAEAAARADRADLTATLWTLRADERMRAGDPVAAAAHAESALASFSGSLGIDVGLYVRLVAAQTLFGAGRHGRALRVMADLLVVALEGNRPSQAASVLSSLANVLARDGRQRLADRCLEAMITIYRGMGARQTPTIEARLRKLRGILSEEPELLVPDEEWEAAARAILAEVSNDLPSSVLA